MANPCKTCTGRGLKCTYNDARKKRGPAPGRIAKILKQQSNTSSQGSMHVLNVRDPMVSPRTNGATAEISPTSTQDGAALHRISTVSSDGFAMADAQPSPTLTYWPSATGDVSQVGNTPNQAREDLGFANTHDGPTQPGTSASYDLDAPDFLLPSLPIDSPPDDSMNLFAAMPEQAMLESVEFWPNSISQEALLPWIDVYFKRLHPTVPVLSRTMIYQEMLLRKHQHDHQFGAMLLAMCAFAMTQPVQIHEVASTPSRSVQARMLLEESIKMRMTIDFGESPSVHMILASFFIFACLFGNGLHKAAHHRLREAVDLANSLSMHLPQAYDSLDSETREQWLRTYLVLSVTER